MYMYTYVLCLDHLKANQANQSEGGDQEEGNVQCIHAALSFLDCLAARTLPCATSHWPQECDVTDTRVLT